MHLHTVRREEDVAAPRAGHVVGLVERVRSLLPLHDIDRDHQVSTPAKRLEPRPPGWPAVNMDVHCRLTRLPPYSWGGWRLGWTSELAESERELARPCGLNCGIRTGAAHNRGATASQQDEKRHALFVPLITSRE